MDTTDPLVEGASGTTERRPLRIFVNYRREDTAADALLLHERLVNRLGAEHVFLDVVDLKPGVRWLEEIKAHTDYCGVFIALIGPRWMSSMINRSQSRFEGTSEDVVKRELEFALARSSGVEVIPAVVGDAKMPQPDMLPRSIRALAALQAVQLRYARFDDDVEYLVSVLEEIRLRPGPCAAREHPAFNPDAHPAAGDHIPLLEEEALAPAAARSESLLRPIPATHQIVANPDDQHYQSVLAYMIDAQSVVPVLGSGVNRGDRDGRWEEGSGCLPETEELAANLARRFGLEPGDLDLAKVAQHISVASGRPDLHKALKRILTAESEPGSVHRFLASFPRQLEQLGFERRYQMIVTSNYDTTLEEAFTAENEPYDLAVYMASGRDRGKFVHVAFDGEPEAVAVPNRYGKFPIDEDRELHRTLIVKIHGAVDGGSGDYRWKENYVITEDHYIDYLSSSPTESLVPVQILDKLTDSHCLFLGYNMGDWNLRVFLKRIWQGEPIYAKSWAIERTPQVLEKDFWNQSGVELFAAPLTAYINELNRHLLALGRVQA